MISFFDIDNPMSSIVIRPISLGLVLIFIGSGILFVGCGKAAAPIKGTTETPTFPPPVPNRTEFTTKVLANFPERVDHKLGWMDGFFKGIDGSPVESEMGALYTRGSNGYTAFKIQDKDGDYFFYCLAKKNEFGDLLLKLKSNDRIRVTGQAVGMMTSVMWLRVDAIQILNP